MPALPDPEPTGAPRWVVYVDMDAYYVSCELTSRPDLVGRPVIVGPDPTLGPTRGVVLSASYEARAFGIHSAQPAALAARLCPEAVWLPADFPRYERMAESVRALLRRHSPRVVALSIDEAAVDCPVADAAGADRFARELKDALTSELGLPASLGVATHRTVAKIASDRAKPGGIVVVPPDRIAAFLAPLPVGAIPGVGPKTRAVLESLGAATLGALAEAPGAVLRAQLGGFGEELRRLARGDPAPEVEEEHGPRSRSAARTLSADSADPDELAREVEALAVGLAASLASEHLRYQTVTLAVRWSDFDRVQRSRSFPSAQSGPAALATTAARLLYEIRAAEGRGRRRAVRALSVGAERLVAEEARQRRLDEFGAGTALTVK